MKYLLIVCLCAFSSFSQISIDVISTDTIDIFNTKQQEANQTPPGIAWLSFIIPGSGHQYIGSANKALGFIALDVFSLTGAFFFKHYSNKLSSNYKAYASHYAGISSSINDDFFWQIIGNFNTYSDFHQTMDLVRDSESRYIDQRYFWFWQDEAYRKEYIKFQKSAKKFNTVSSFFVGALVLNRIVAFIDIRSTLKNNRFKNSPISFKPVIIGPSASGVVVETAF